MAVLRQEIIEKIRRLAEPRNACFSQEWPRNCPIIASVLILSLDTSSPAGSLAVLRDDKVIGVISTWVDETYSSRMFRHLEFLLRELRLDLKQFDLFAVAAGPGSFTGLRVGLTAVKGWAEVYDKPTAGISALEAVAMQAHSTSPILIPVLDAHRGEVYFGFYHREGQGLALEGEECVTTRGEFVEAVRARAADTEVTIVTPVLEVISKEISQIENFSGSIEQVSTVLAPLIGQLGYQRALRGQLSDALSLDANYVRRTDAEVHLKGPS
jgi:tRNA threonylcarbamoyladenosine biosynthesis protein TsaB